MDIGNHVETHQQEILCAPGPRKVPDTHSEVGLRHSHKLEGGFETVDGGGGRGGLKAARIGPPTPLGGLAPDEGVVLVCG